MNRGFLKGLGLWIGLCLSGTAQAGIFNPDDTAILSRMLAIQSLQLPKLPEQLKELVEQNKNLAQIKKYMSGNTGFEDLFNQKSDMDKRLWANDNWDEVLKVTGGGKNAGFARAQQRYAQQYRVRDKKDIGQSLKDTDLIRMYYEQKQQISRAALAASSYSYNGINQHIQSIHDILAKIKDSPTEKAALDMNARMLAEISYIQLESLRQQNFQTQLMATQSQGEVNGMSEQARFNEWHSTRNY